MEGSRGLTPFRISTWAAGGPPILDQGHQEVFGPDDRVIQPPRDDLRPGPGIPRGGRVDELFADLLRAEVELEQKLGRRAAAFHGQAQKQVSVVRSRRA